MMKMLLLIFMVLLQNYIVFVNAVECNTYTDAKKKSKDVEVTPLHHITEFGKRDQIDAKDCGKKNHTNGKNSSKFSSALGLHTLLHVRSQKGKQQTGTRRENEPMISEPLVIKTQKKQVGIKRTEDEQKKLHNIQLRTETIRMLHKIVKKYFPGGKLSVDQKIKALKILGKLIKLKKEGKNADVKAILDSLPKKSSNSLKDKVAESSTLKEGKQENVSGSEDKISNNIDKDPGGGGTEGDIYATIASGPDMPKLPPSVSGKDSEHAHSNIMPVGFQPMANGGELMNSINHPNDISDRMGDFSSEGRGNLWSSYSNQQYPEVGLGQGQIYNTGNSYYNEKFGFGGPSMMNGAADTRSRMPFLPRYRHDENNDDRVDDDDDADDDDGDDDEDDNGDDEEESAHTRSYVHRHGYNDDDEDDDDVVEYRSRFNRKDNIAKSPKKGKSPLQSKGKKSKSLIRH